MKNEKININASLISLIKNKIRLNKNLYKNKSKSKIKIIIHTFAFFLLCWRNCRVLILRHSNTSFNLYFFHKNVISSIKFFLIKKSFNSTICWNNRTRKCIGINFHQSWKLQKYFWKIRLFEGNIHLYK